MDPDKLSKWEVRFIDSLTKRLSEEEDIIIKRRKNNREYYQKTKDRNEYSLEPLLIKKQKI